MVKDILPQIDQWREAGKRVALATVVQVYGSAPRPLGAKLAVSEDGAIVGSVSGGCVESATAQEALDVLSTGKPRLVSYGIADETAWEVGLACGGTIEVFIEPLETDRDSMIHMMKTDHDYHGLALVTALGEANRKLLLRRTVRPGQDEPDVTVLGSLGHPALDQAAIARAQDAITARRTTRLTLSIADLDESRPQLDQQEWDLLIDVHLPQETLVIVGAVHIAIPLVAFARQLGLRTVVIDARPIFATQDRFDHADELIRRWPDEFLAEMNLNESTYVVTLTHDEKPDTPALIRALEHPVGYVGALGSRRTHAKRMSALRAAGVTDQQIARIHAPIGLDLGGRSPEEIALAIIAEIVQTRNRQGET